MGLAISHDAFRGAYSAFNRLRWAICQAMGGSWPETLSGDQIWYWGEGYSRKTHPGLHRFLCHSDCDGKIHPKTASKLADELEALLPEIEKQGMGEGHIEHQGGYRGVTEKLIAGCRLAAKEGKSLVFH